MHHAAGTAPGTVFSEQRRQLACSDIGIPAVTRKSIELYPHLHLHLAGAALKRVPARTTGLRHPGIEDVNANSHHIG